MKLRHTEALEEAKNSVRLSHLLAKDLQDLCKFFIKKPDEEINDPLESSFSAFSSLTDKSSKSKHSTGFNEKLIKLAINNDKTNYRLVK
jgi:hypothetical protein